MAVAVAILTLLGLALRISRFGQSMLGDELSTLYIIEGNGLWDTVQTVSSDAEISPPLYFIFAWLSAQFGSAPELIRLPSLIAGTLSIPLTYLVGARAVGRGTGVVAAGVMALSPFMIFYSTDGRTYALAIALLLGSTLAMLVAIRTGRTRWWVAYGVCTCLAMYAHYTSAFVLGAQLVWLLWAHPHARREALLATGAAAIAFVPWIPSTLSDFDNPTVKILSLLQGDGFEVKRLAVEGWAFGYPFVLPEELPGSFPILLAVIALCVAAAVGLLRYLRSRRRKGRGGQSVGRDGEGLEVAASPFGISRGTVLVLALALATPVAEGLILAFGGTDLFGARNLNTSSAGLALSIGAILTSAGPLVGTLCTLAVAGSFAIGAAKTLETRYEAIHFESVAEFIEAEARPGDVVVDAMPAGLTPVPNPSLDVYLNEDSKYKLFLPVGPPPFLPLKSDPPPPNPVLREGFREAGQNRVFLVLPGFELERGGETPRVGTPPGPGGFGFANLQVGLPSGARVVEERTYPGVLTPITVLVIDQAGAIP